MTSDPSPSSDRDRVHSPFATGLCLVRREMRVKIATERIKKLNEIKSPSEKTATGAGLLPVQGVMY